MSALDWERLTRARMHPTQLRILEHLAERGETSNPPDSPARMAKRFGDSLGNVSYHTKELKKRNLIRVHHQVSVRGAVEHFYVLRAGVVRKEDQ